MDKAPKLKEKEDFRNKVEHILEKQDLYKNIQEEIDSVIIEEKDRDLEGNLLAPNGKISNLPEKEWKIARTPSFLEKFGNWKEKYNKEEYNLWLKYQKMQKWEDFLERKNKDIELHKKQLKYYTSLKETIVFEQKRRVNINHEISKIHSELMNAGFNIYSTSLDYTKILDENGEPLLLFRGTDFKPNENGKFIIPKKSIDGEEFEVGVFLGEEREARHHYNESKNIGYETNLYSVFVDARNFRIYDEKPNYWRNPSTTKELQRKYDGLWVNKYDRGNNETYDENENINLMDYVCFDTENILIVGVE